MLAETPVTQRSPCYSAVSSSLTNPLPDCSNYSPVCHTHYRILRIIVSSGQTLYQGAWLETNTSLLQCFTVESSQNSGEMQCPEEAEQQAEASADVPYPPLQIVNSVPFCLFSLSLLPFSILSLLPFLISPSLSTIPSFFSDQFFVILR